MAFHARDGLRSLVVVWHFYKTKTFRTSGVFILNNAGTRYLTALAKEL